MTIFNTSGLETFSISQNFQQLQRQVQPPMTQQPVASQVARNLLSQELRLNTRPQQFVRVCFSNRGLAKVLQGTEDVDSHTPNASTVLRMANALRDLEIKNTPAQGFLSLSEFFGIDYIGYIIDKERLDKSSKEWIRTDEYKIVGAEANNFKDSRVAYGNCYRYRIRAVMKVTVEDRRKTFQNFEFLQNIRQFEQERIKEQLRIKRRVVAQIEKIENRGLKPKISRGRRTTSFSLLEGLRIDANEEKVELRQISVPVSANRMRNSRRLKNLRVQEERLTTGIVSRAQLQRLINNNLKQIREELIEYNSFYYEGYASNNWVYVDISENVPPPPPEAIKIIPCTPLNQIMVTWLKPANTQRDIGGKKGGFKLWRRNRIGERWNLLKFFRENENVYIDKAVRVGGKYIYALTSVDAHGFESFLSTQIEATLNANFSLEEKEKPLKWISGSGLDPHKEVNVVLRKFDELAPPLVAKQKFTLRPTTEFAETKKNLLIRVTSLDTHEKKEFKVDLKNTNIRNV